MTSRIPSGMQKADRKNRQWVFDALGGKCVKCGFTDVRALQVDHIDATTKRNAEPGGVLLYRLLRHGTRQLKDFQLLCCNCHCIKTFEDRECETRERRAKRFQILSIAQPST